MNRGPLRRACGPAALLLVLSAVIGTVYLAAGTAGRPPSGALRLTAGATRGVYYAFLDQLAAHLRARDRHLTVTVEASDGSVQNLERVAGGTADCGIAAGDAAALAVAGERPFYRPEDIAAVARVYDGYVQLVVRADSGISALADIRGRSLSLGADGSGVRLISSRLLRVARIPEAAVHTLALGFDDSVAALTAGRIDGFFWSGGVPTPAVAQLVSSGRAELVPLGAFVDAMSADYGQLYRAATIPAGSYGDTRALDTIAVANVIVCGRAVRDDIVEFLTDTLFRYQPAIAQVVPAVNAMNKGSAIDTGPLPLHPGAVSWYRHSKR
ncbi:MAG: uncharacterized protein QOE97_760 [Pseudonocardiales bacterium]|jgi:TRAP transporter TAXI family solute receptor|nr:uncharacterized protein [Pseudonocardiales bacterium]